MGLILVDIDELRAATAEIPRRPGVYFMKGADEEELYVGKAKVLRSRVRQYFDNSPKDDKTTALVAEIDHFDYI